MALVTYGPIVSNARKKIGGIVATKGHAGNFLRSKVAPIQPRTTAQRNVRANFTALAKTWQTLGALAIASFNALAASVKKKDRLGNSVTSTGFQLFMSLSRNLLSVPSYAPLTTAPASLVATSPGTLAAVAGPGGTQVLGAVTVTGPNAVYAITSYAGPPPEVGQTITIAAYATGGNNVTGKITAIAAAFASLTLATTTQVTEALGTGTGTAALAMQITPTTYPATGEVALVFAAAGISAGRSFVGKAYRLIQVFGIIATPPAIPYDITANYLAKFGTPSVGKAIPILVKHVNGTSGAAGIPTAALPLFT